MSLSVENSMHLMRQNFNFNLSTFLSIIRMHFGVGPAISDASNGAATADNKVVACGCMQSGSITQSNDLGLEPKVIAHFVGNVLQLNLEVLGC